MATLQGFLNDCPFDIFDCSSLKIGKKLGEGANAEVYKVIYNDKPYAIKIYKYPTTYSISEFYDNLLYELKVAERLKDTKHSVKVYGVGHRGEKEDKEILIFMEKLNSNGDLYDYIQKVGKWTTCYRCNGTLIPQPKTDYIYNEDKRTYWCYELSTKQKIKITKSLIQAVIELHSKGVIHGDIKTANVVLHYSNKKQTIKLVDFGMAYFINKGEKTIKIDCKSGTPGYRAPEQDNYELCYGSDIYSLGVTIVELWNGDIWYEGEDFKECRKEVFNGLRRIEKNHFKFGKLLRTMISLNPVKRPTAERVIRQFNSVQFYE